MLLALLGMPLAIVALERALREARGLEPSELNPLPLALGGMLAYNYFLYRGLFNYVLGVPLAIGSLAAIVACGARRASRVRRVALGVCGCALALLAALAHPAALVFLLAAIPAACLAPGRARRI